MEPVIRIDGLSKVFSDGWRNQGRQALAPLSMEIASASILGVAGGNGSGKSTLLKLLCGLLEPTAGAIEVLGVNPTKAVRHGQVGYVSERPGFPGHATPRKLLLAFGKLSGLSGDLLRSRLEECLKTFELEEQADLAIRKLSKGGVQRLSLTQALIHDPQVILLDEPLDGLDPRARERVVALVNDWRLKGKTVILSSHFLNELQTLCDQVLILHQCRSIYQGRPDFDKGMEAWLLERLRKAEGVHE